MQWGERGEEKIWDSGSLSYPWVRMPSDGESRERKEEMIHIFMFPHTHIVCGYT